MTENNRISSGPPEGEQQSVQLQREVIDLRIEVERLSAIVSRLSRRRVVRMEGPDVALCIFIAGWVLMVIATSVLPPFAGGGS